MTDTIANMFSIIKNGYKVKREIVTMPYAKILDDIANVLKSERYIEGFEVKKEKNFKILILTLKYINKTPVLTDINIISKPGLRVYARKDSIPKVLGGIGKVIISTSKGIMTGDEAKKKGMGGEIICKIW